MKNLWFISDTHFHQANILNFKRMNGEPLRSFQSVEEMNEIMVERWNSLVKPGDKIYHLGDVIMRYQPENLKILSRLNGQKRLILGNHDTLKGTELVKYFKKVEMWRVFGEYGFLCSHVPIHSGSFGRAVLNVHGHTHDSIVKIDVLDQPADPRYFCVCVEQTDYFPVHLDVILDKVKELS